MSNIKVPLIAVGGIRYETNSFAPLGSFDMASLRRGSEVLDPLPSTEIAGAVAAAFGLGVMLKGTLDLFGGCGGLADHEQFLGLLDELVERMRRGPKPDGVYLALHGAMATTGTRSADAMVVERVRAVVGPGVPIVASCDLHAAVDDLLVSELVGIVGFKTCPHVDYEKAGDSALRILHSAITGDTQPGIYRLTVPLITAAESHDTNTGPLAEHMAHAIAGIGGDILDVSIFAVQPWLDTLRTSWAVTVTFDTTAGSESARAIASDLRERLVADRRSFLTPKVSPAAAAEMIVPKASSPLLLADSGDSPSAGATGGSTDLLAHVLAAGDAKVLATITDSEVARQFRNGIPGMDATVQLGGVAELEIEPLELTVRLVSVKDGRFRRDYPAAECDAGACVVLTSGNVTIVVTERPAFMLDLSLFDHVGIVPNDFDAVLVKSAGGFRARWSSISENIVTVDSRGASTSKLFSLPYHLADRNILVSTDTGHHQLLEDTA